MLQLDETHRVSNDNSNFVLQKFRKTQDRKTKKFKEAWHNEGYFSSAKGAIQAYVSRGLDDCGNYQEVLDRLDLLESVVKEQL